MSLWKQMLSRKEIETILAEMAGEHRLRRVLGPVALTAIGVGAIIGAGIFVMTGLAARNYAGPAVIVSYAVAAIGCGFAALCYAEFAAMAPVAGSAYTYAYATLGELLAWIIGWDLILEYGMSCATVASAWSGYFNKMLHALGLAEVPAALSNDPFTHHAATGSYGGVNLVALAIMAAVTSLLVVGVRESATTNAVLVVVKTLVVLFVIFMGLGYINTQNWTGISPERVAEVKQAEMESQRAELIKQNEKLAAENKPGAKPLTDAEIHAAVEQKLIDDENRRWGMLHYLGVASLLKPYDDKIKSPFFPYGLSGMMVGAAIVFFAYIGFDAVSTHAEEAKNPQRDMPIAILVSLGLCSLLYVAVAAVVTGIAPYYSLSVKAPIADAFATLAGEKGSAILNGATVLIAIGALAGMTSVLLITFQSQVRVFLAMARDGLLPRAVATVHPRFMTPHLTTMVTGAIVCVTAALIPIEELGEMVNIGTLFAFIVVCAAVLIMRRSRPDAVRPFRCPAVWLIGSLGIGFNLLMMLFLAPITWLRLFIWLAIGLAIYFLYGRRHSTLGKRLQYELQRVGMSPSDAPLPRN